MTTNFCLFVIFAMGKNKGMWCMSSQIVFGRAWHHTIISSSMYFYIVPSFLCTITAIYVQLILLDTVDGGGIKSEDSDLDFLRRNEGGRRRFSRPIFESPSEEEYVGTTTKNF